VPGANGWVTSIHRAAERDCLKSLDGGQIKPREPTKAAKEDLFLGHLIVNNEYLSSTLRLFQTVSEGVFPETQEA
jgi:hypothetical protein